MELLDLLDSVAGRAIAYLTALALIVATVRWAWRASRRLHGISDALDWIQAEMKPNGGNSLRDRVDKMDAKLDGHLAEHARNPVTVNVGAPAPTP